MSEFKKLAKLLGEAGKGPSSQGGQPKRDKTARELIDEIHSACEGDELVESIIVLIADLRPPKRQSLKSKTALLLTEGKTEKDGHFLVRLDKRPIEQGGFQLHITDLRGGKWAYRQTGARSEPNKYTLPTTNAVRDVVSRRFNIPPSNVAECKVVGKVEGSAIFEVTLA